MPPPAKAEDYVQTPDGKDEDIQLLCKGIAVERDEAKAESENRKTGEKVDHTFRTETERPVEILVTLSYQRGAMELPARDFPGLIESRENPEVVQSIHFDAQRDSVIGVFKSGKQRALRALFSLGRSELMPREHELHINRKTGRFRFLNASGTCEKVEFKENRF